MSTVETRNINITPDRSLMGKIGQTGYSVSQAIAELVDNSIDARRDSELVEVAITFKVKEQLIEIIDDGVGMNESTASNSIKLAHSDKKGESLGEFGLGLKSAATSLGRKFSIITKQRGDDKEYIVEYDEANWLARGDWTRHEMKIRSGVDSNRSGTKIVIENLRFKIYPNQPGNIRNDLASRFAPFIENGEVEISVNNKVCRPEPLELNENYGDQGKEHFEFPLESGNVVRGWRGLLKRGSGNKGNYGFRVFRRGRLIEQHAKIGFSAHPESRQIIGEIHLDHIPVTHNKREFIHESPLWTELVKEGGDFWKFMRSIVAEARSKMRAMQLGPQIEEKVEEQKEIMIEAIRKISDLKEYAFPDVKEKVRSNSGDQDGIDLVEVEKRARREIASVEVEDVEEHVVSHDPKSKNRTPKKTQTKRAHFIWVNGKKFRVEHKFIDLKTDECVKDKKVDEIAGICVYTNTAFPGFGATKDHVFYAVWNIAEAIAEVMVEQNGKSSEKILEIRDKILQHSATIALNLENVKNERKEAERLKKEYEAKMSNIRKLEAKHAFKS